MRMVLVVTTVAALALASAAQAQNTQGWTAARGQTFLAPGQPAPTYAQPSTACPPVACEPCPCPTPPPRYAYRPVYPLFAMPPSYAVGRGLLGQPKLYVPGQPVRNFFRYISP